MTCSSYLAFVWRRFRVWMAIFSGAVFENLQGTRNGKFYRYEANASTYLPTGSSSIGKRCWLAR